MIDVGLLFAVLLVCAAAGFACLRVLRALPRAANDALLAATAVGLGIAGVAALALAAAGALRPLPLAELAALAVVAGGRDVVRAMAGVDGGALRRVWPAILVCAVVLAAELPAMLAPPVGGDQTKYQLVYPRLYAAHGGLVDTPWSFWGHVQFLPNFVFALGYAVRGEALARLLNAAFGVLAALALARLVGAHLRPRAGAAAAVVFFTLPMTWSLMTRTASDLALLLYAFLAVAAFLAWRADGRGGDLRRAALLAGLGAGTKLMGPLLAVLLGLAVVVGCRYRKGSVARTFATATGFALLVIVAGSPWYVRNAIETGNPVYPFGYEVFGGRHWSAEASEYLDDYYQQYRIARGEDGDSRSYVGLDLLRLPWDLTMHPDALDDTARRALDVGPFALAFAPAVLLVRRRRPQIAMTAAFGLAYVAVIAAGTWAHPRYVFPGVVLLLAASVSAAGGLVPRRVFRRVVVLTVLGNLVLIGRMLPPIWPDQVRVAVGALEPATFLRRHAPDYPFWEQANDEIGPAGLVLVLEKVPHPYYIEAPFVLGSYLEQGLLDYRTLDTPVALAAAVHALGVTHVAVDVASLDAAGDPFEARVARLWRAFLVEECEPQMLREGGYALYPLRSETEGSEVVRAYSRADNLVCG
jgi:hypothetical protein